MLGYVTIAKSELKIREYDVYQGYYCGICKAIGQRCGQLPRMTLSYDAVFLAMVLAALEEDGDELEMQHCIVHPIKKKPVVLKQKAIDYAADVMVILAYHKFLDDWNDDKSAKALGGKALLGRAYKRLAKQYPLICEKVEEKLAALSALERENCGKLDLVADAFADVMEVLFQGYYKEGECESLQRILGQMGRWLGRWIYIIDALDDYEKDVKDGAYNPLRFREWGLAGLGDLLYDSLAEITFAYDLLDIKKNAGIIENILFMGLRQRTDALVKERIEKHEESI